MTMIPGIREQQQIRTKRPKDRVDSRIPLINTGKQDVEARNTATCSKETHQTGKRINKGIKNRLFVAEKRNLSTGRFLFYYLPVINPFATLP
jgi:hypothetical protein